MRALITAVALAFAAPAFSGVADDQVTGHYYLQGVMETGSELLLKPDGRFEWYLSAGSMDIFAGGKWQRDGNQLTLSADAADPDRASIVELEREPWQINTERVLRNAINGDRKAAAYERCTFLSDSADLTEAMVPVKGYEPLEPALPTATDALQALNMARADAEKAMNAAAADLSNGSLSDAAVAARAKWLNARNIYRDVSWKAGIATEDDAEPAIPAACGAAELPADDMIAESDWLRAIAITLGDPKLEMRLNGYDVRARYADGHIEQPMTRGSGFVFVPKRAGQPLVELNLTAEWMPPGGKSVSIKPMDEGLLVLAIDSMLLREPPFRKMELTITADGLTSADIGRGVYRKQ
jgi:hypothetical protein